MENDVKLIGKFYMKNGAIIENEVIFDKDNDKRIVENYIQDVKCQVKEGLGADCDFCITFGYTMFRGKDISAVTFTVEDV